MNKIKAPRVVTIAVFTTITIIFWIFFNVYHVLTTPSEVQVDPALLQPIDPTLNTEVLDSIESGIFFDESAINAAVYDTTPDSNELKTTEPENTIEEEDNTELESSIPTTTPAISPDDSDSEGLP